MKNAPLKERFKLFIKQSKLHFGDLFDYSESNYINDGTKIVIFCNKHKIYFEQYPTHHRKGFNGCKRCKAENQSKKARKKNTDQFIKEALRIHNNKYDYSLVEYIHHQQNVTKETFLEWMKK